MKLFSLISWFCLISISLVNAQGVVSYGAFIHSNANSFLVLSGNTDLIFEDFNGSSGAIVLDGTTNLSGDLINNSSSVSIISSGTGILFLDGRVSQEIGGDNSLILKSMDIQNDVFLSNDLTVTSNLNFTDGVISLSDFDLKINSGGTISGSSSTNFVKTDGIGNLALYATSGGASVLFPVGTSVSYTPVSIGLNSGTSQYFYVRLLDGVWSDGISGSNLALVEPVVNRTWVIYSDLAHDVDLSLQWNESDEVNGFDRTSAFSNVYDDQWTSSSATVSGSDPFQVTFSGVTDLNTSTVHAINDQSSPLGIELLTFDAKAEATFNHVFWSTISEYNSDYFSLLKSVDNINFELISTQKSAGNSSTLISYSYDDFNTSEGLTYYKIVEHDLDGKLSISKTISVNRTSSNIQVWQFEKNLIIDIKNYSATNLLINIFDMNGKIIASNELDKVGSNSLIKFDLSQLVKGVYIIKISNNENLIWNSKLVLN